jgi:hypothetical protein
MIIYYHPPPPKKRRRGAEVGYMIIIACRWGEVDEIKLFFNPRESIIYMIKQSFSYLIIPVCPKDFHRELQVCSFMYMSGSFSCSFANFIDNSCIYVIDI